MAEERTIEITTTHNVSDELLESILCNAYEGGVYGIGCWAVARNRKINDEKNIEYISYEVCDEEDYIDADEDESKVEWHLVDKNVVAKGLKLAIEKGYDYISAIVNDDGGELDAADADNIVQLGVFGEVVYG